MNHLTDEQLSAHLDGALPPRDAEAATTHLAGCADCRARLADASALDASLSRALDHDPGEAYFASFADRVGERIAAEARAAAAPARAAATPAPKRGWFAWWNSPRGLALAGGALALCAVAAVALVWSRQHGVDEFARSESALRQPEAARPQASAPAPTAQARVATPPVSDDARAGAASGSLASRVLERDAKDVMPSEKQKRAAAAKREESPAPGRLDALKEAERTATSGRAQEVRPLPNGEFETVPPRPGPGNMPAPPAAAPAEPGRIPKPLAQPMSAGAGANTTQMRDQASAPATPAPVADGAKFRGGVTKTLSALDKLESLAVRRPDARRQAINPGFMQSPAPAAVPEAKVAVRAEPLPEDASAPEPEQTMIDRARKLVEVAGRLHTALAWERAAEGWAKALAMASSDANAVAARFQIADARMHAWRTEDTPERLQAARAAVEAFLVTAPDGADRVKALAWRAALAAH